MTTFDWYLLGALIITWVIGGIWGYRQMNWKADYELRSIHHSFRQDELERKWVRFKNQRKELYASLADPEKIAEDLEKSADLREMRDAGRTTLPRADAGPPTTVHRPPLRNPVVGSWNPRTPGSPSKY